MPSTSFATNWRHVPAHAFAVFHMYLPRWLGWLPRLEHEPAPKATPVPEAA